MNNIVKWIIFLLLLITINTFTFFIASFSMFGTQENVSIFSFDYLFFYIIFLLSNIIVFQLYFSIKKNLYFEFNLGLVIGLLQILGLYLIVNTMYFSIGLIIICLSILLAIGLLIKVIKF